MSHEYEDQILIIEPEWELQWYYVIPYLDRSQWDGVEYEEIKYDWNELDYRFGVDYNSTVPEPASAGVIIGALALIALLINKYNVRKENTK
jgi:hypothetical protein